VRVDSELCIFFFFILSPHPIPEREAKKVSARTTAFQTQKKALYASARQAAKDLAREGTACL
jgi:hypothetical protein